MTTQAIIYHAAGAPPMAGGTSGACRMCGQIDTGIDFAGWVKDTFTDHDKLYPGTILCHACQFCTAEASELLQSLTGKDKPQRMRNYSHFVVDGIWYPLSKGDKRRMRELLPTAQVAIIATSGQKHIIFRARPGWWQIEEQAMRPDVAGWQATQALTDSLYAGFTKEEIEAGRYGQHRIRAFGIERWYTLEQQIRPLRGSLLLQLAIFLAQKEERHDQPGDSGTAPVPDLARGTGRVQEQICTEHLGAVPESDQERGLHQQTFDFF